MTGVGGLYRVRGFGLSGGHRDGKKTRRQTAVDFPRETAIGALGLYISDTTVSDFQPMNVNFGIMPPLGYRIKGRQAREKCAARRALA